MFFPRTVDAVSEDAPATGLLQRTRLRREVLFVGRNAGVADEQVWGVKKLVEGTLSFT